MSVGHDVVPKGHKMLQHCQDTLDLILLQPFGQPLDLGTFLMAVGYSASLSLQSFASLCFASSVRSCTHEHSCSGAIISGFRPSLVEMGKKLLDCSDAWAIDA